jgi:2-dehydro-3-deoxyphosphogluconate aldolase / (4S)-4-hydroxy-2-oxoglutarate aldolase
MDLKEKFAKALSSRIIPVVTIHEAKSADALIEALTAGGLSCAEVTFRTDAALAAIKKIGKRDDVILGAGTVLKREQVSLAVENGACFIVSPGFNPKVVQFCIENHIPVVPGVSNPTDIEMALDFGLELVKFFPAEAFGGIKTLKAISGPYTMMRFIPTGGIGPNNLVEYLSHPKVPACGGTWMVKPELIRKKDFEAITRLTKEAVQLAGQAPGSQ